MTKQNHEQLVENLRSYFKRIGGDQNAQNDAEIYETLYKQFLSENAFIDWKSWTHISEEVQKEASKIAPFDPLRKDVLEKIAVIKLNGGLGTTMGCDEPKSFVVLRDELSFLDIALGQHRRLNEKYGANVPIYLMNSFSTQNTTLEKLKEMNREDVICFEQSKCPRIGKETLLPIDDPTWGDDAWYPPGHGNIFESLLNTGTLDTLLAEGKEIIFVSNIDNTGATLDLAIAQFMLDNGLDYIMECTKKTQNDIKGGTLIEINGQLMHLEMPQVPPEHLEDFCSTKVFKIFNTNNIWVNLKAAKRLMPNIRSEIIVNHKTVREKNVIQLETSIGGCIKNFNKAYCIHVGRERFRPVKRIEDLVIMASNLFSLNDDFTLTQNAPILPTINLGEYFNTIQKFDERMHTIPGLQGAESITVSGNVKFGKNVNIKGTVSITNTTEKEVLLEDTTLDNDEYKY